MKNLTTKNIRNPQNEEIIVRKPKPPKFFGFARSYERYSNKWYKWQCLLPNNGDMIKITWFPDNNGYTNAYIGFEGVVQDMNKTDGSFTIKSANALLVCTGDFNYIIVNI